MDHMLHWLDADMYYFGAFVPNVSFTPRAPQQVPTDVKRKIVEWHKGDPKPWAERMFKPYFPNV